MNNGTVLQPEADDVCGISSRPFSCQGLKVSLAQAQHNESSDSSDEGEQKRIKSRNFKPIPLQDAPRWLWLTLLAAASVSFAFGWWPCCIWCGGESHALTPLTHPPSTLQTHKASRAHPAEYLMFIVLSSAISTVQDLVMSVINTPCNYLNRLRV